MPTREEVFEELGLMPVYVRKGYVPTRENSAIPAAQNSQISNEVSKISAEISAPTMPLKKQTNSDARAERIAALDWDALEADIAQCTACGLCKTRTNTVPGAGARNANWMIVGEAPGADEDEQGKPFVGRSGKLLDAMLRATNHSREKNVFIANTLKCRPPDNRNPAPDELAACAPYLHRQIALMKPKMLLTVGKFAAQTITGSEDAIGAMRGRTFDYQNIPVRVTYHPSYLLRAPLEKAKAWDDLLAAMKLFPAK
jgi:uracil-DNA glycosylase